MKGANVIIRRAGVSQKRSNLFVALRVFYTVKVSHQDNIMDIFGYSNFVNKILDSFYRLDSRGLRNVILVSVDNQD